MNPKIQQYMDATETVWGMGKDISVILAVYGTLLGGNLVSLNPSVSMVRSYPASFACAQIRGY